MLKNLDIEKILFLDIETVPEYSGYDELPVQIKKLWDRKAEYIKRDKNETPDILYSRAGIYAEFGKIICISVGFIKNEEARIKSFAGEDEKILLEEFANLIREYYSRQDYLLCAHNGKEFDFPYIARRMLINGIDLPATLDHAGKKPWEIPHLDTMELWKFGDFKSYTSLELLAAIFKIQTPKDDMDGSEVYKIYWEHNDLERIVNYCQKDVLTIIQLFLKYQGKQLLPDDKVSIIE